MTKAPDHVSRALLETFERSDSSNGDNPSRRCLMSIPAESRYFPSAKTADADGLVAVGGHLGVEILLDAYDHGIFPWPIFPDELPMAWWSLDPRAIFEVGVFRLTRRLKRTIRSGKFRLTLNRSFGQVIEACATVDDREAETWITPEMGEAFRLLHRQGHAHSVEAWEGRRLVGGVYGVARGGYFAAESMFHRVRDASKVALAGLLAHLAARGFGLIDIQQPTDHTVRYGATTISRSEFLQRLEIARLQQVTMGNSLQGDLLSLRKAAG